MFLLQEEFVQWRLTVPRKKKLVNTESADHEGSSGYSNAPILQLGQFKHENSVVEHIHVQEDNET